MTSRTAYETFDLGDFTLRGGATSGTTGANPIDTDFIDQRLRDLLAG